MKTFSVSGQKRESVGKKDSKQLRSENKVPCVLYGIEEPIHFCTVKNELLKLIYTPNVYLIDLNIDGKKHQAIMKDIQFDPVSDEVIHIDYMKISDDKPIKVEIPVEVVGYAAGLRKGGKLQIEVRRLKVVALPKYLPDSIKIDVTPLDLGQSLRVGDIKMENVTILNGKSVPVARVMVTRAARAASQKE
ncbi:MAG: 50S ribosomal protein L25/general stress protein Ctc [Prolixibacteraceae bacterium]|nr:50S ribosomal protein L25/general stress protein Ctc [Prolixibacteraceae bacterium]